MYRKNIYTVICCLLPLLTTAAAHADEMLDLNEMKYTFTGNTIDAENAKSKASYQMYLHPSGDAIRSDSKANIEKGKWRISKDSELCIEFDSEVCHAVKKISDDRYDLYSADGELDVIIRKIALGNPNKMK